MIKVSSVSFSLAAALAVTTFVAGTSISFDAEARTYKADRYVNRDKCYKVKKVPQLVEYDTKGIFVRGASRSWSGNLRKHGSVVKKKYNDPVYIRTVRVLEDQHYTLIPSKCK
ncbi:MAG: hypothetical protein OIF58_08665 [Cohaesibacter sp.]|nr:hypothetical protein [Cohaesibacter sp.]